jgi:hypothetical protein
LRTKVLGVFIMTFLKHLLFRHSEKIRDYFADAVKVYVLTGEEDVRRAALASAKNAGERQRKLMIENLSKMTSNVMKNLPDRLARKSLADRLLALKQDIESKNWDVNDAREEKEKIENPASEYLSCLDQADPSIFRRKYPELF